MTISNNYPTVQPSLNLDFANAQQLDPRITFSRSTTAAYYDANTTALAEQNLFLQSQNLAAFGSVQNLTFTSNSTAAPDGTTTATTLNEGTNTGGHTTYQSYSSTAGLNYTISFYVKYISSQYVSMFSNSGGNNWMYSVFDVLNGVYVNSTTQGTGWAIVSNSITSVGNSWYRITTTYTCGSTNSAAVAGIQMANSSTLPTGGSYGQLSYTGVSNTIYAWGAQLEQRSSVTAYNATTTTAITNYIPVLQTAPINQARFDHDPVARTSLGLLIEQQSTNLLTWSSDYTNAAWTFSGATITPNAGVAPDGTQTASILVQNTAAGNHIMQGTTGFAATSSSVYTTSFYFKAAATTRVAIVYFGTFSANPVADFNLATGTIANQPSGNSSSASIISVGNGWYRCSMTATASSSGTAIPRVYLLSSSGALSYTGDGYSGAYVWGAQAEALAFPTSYIPTQASQVTRAADIASMTGVNVTSWLNNGQGTYYSEFNTINTNAQFGLLSNQLTTNGRIIYGINGNIYNYDGTTIGTLLTSVANNNFYKVITSLTQTLNTNTGSGNVPTTSSTNGNFLNTTTLNIGNFGSPFYLNGRIKKLAYYPVALTATQLQALTGS